MKKRFMVCILVVVLIIGAGVAIYAGNFSDGDVLITSDCCPGSQDAGMSPNDSMDIDGGTFACGCNNNWWFPFCINRPVCRSVLWRFRCHC